jgi:molecular chaperone DnaJ
MDYYEILGIPKTATQDDISKAYRKKAMQYHPDVSKEADAAEKFKKIAEAHDVLGDPQKRAQYDRYGSVGQIPQIDPFDVYANFFGGVRNQKRGRDRVVEAELEFDESVQGCKKDISVTYKDFCQKCKGTGVEQWQNCSVCKGRGRQTIQQRPFMLEMSCQACGGQGRSPSKECQECNGAGFKDAKTEVVSVKIPAGISTGVRIRLAGLGDFDETHSVRGDLYVVIKVKDHEFFVREGNDLWCKIPMPFTKLVFGDTVKVPTLSDVVEVKIPANTSPGTKLRLRGRGLPDISFPGRMGDIIVVVELDMPEAKGEYKKKLRELSILEDECMSSKRQAFNNRLERIR